MRIFLDANILFSAAKSDGAVHRLLELLLAARHELVVDEFVLTEARRNLEAKGPPGAVGALVELTSRMTCAAGGSLGAELEDLALLPEKDRPVLDAAIRLGCAVLVTGDRTHFGELFGRSIRGVSIQSPLSLATLGCYSRN